MTTELNSSTKIKEFPAIYRQDIKDISDTFDDLGTRVDNISNVTIPLSESKILNRLNTINANLENEIDQLRQILDSYETIIADLRNRVEALESK